jgi:hypothetical protein
LLRYAFGWGANNHQLMSAHRTKDQIQLEAGLFPDPESVRMGEQAGW